MTEQSMFFSDGTYYSQNVFARVWQDIYGQNGVFDGIDNELSVGPITPAGMAVKVDTGRSYVQGYFHEILDDPVQLTISAADTTNDRIDRIVLRLDVDTNRKIAVAVLEGTPATSPVAPTLTQTDSIYEISLAQVYVAANATSIVASNITDERTYVTFKIANTQIASSTALGVVKGGDGVSVASDGTMTCTLTKLRVTPTMVTTTATCGTCTVTPSASSGTFTLAVSNIDTSQHPGYIELVTPITVHQAGAKITINASSFGSGKSTTATVYRVSTGASLGSCTANGAYGEWVSATGTATMPDDFEDGEQLRLTLTGSVVETYSLVGSVSAKSNNIYI